jgi:AraC-like DNA-binding protein
MLVFLVAYITAFTIPIIIHTIIYHTQLQTTVEDYQNANMQIVKQCSDYLDARIEDMDSIISQFDSDPVLNYLLATSATYESGALTYKLWLMVNKMEIYKKSNSFFHDFSIYIQNKNLLISSTTIYSNLKYEYGELFSLDALDYQGFIAMVSDSCYKTFIPVMKYKSGQIIKKESDVILYMDSLPKTNYRKDGCLYFLIPVSNIEKIFDQLSAYKGSIAYIVDSKQNILYRWPQSGFPGTAISEISGTTGFQEVVIDQERIQLYSVFSQKSGLTFISMVPYSTILHRVLFIKQISWISAVSLFLFGVSISFFMARKNSRPILDLVNIIQPTFEGSEIKNNTVGFKQLHGSIASLMSNNEKMSKMLEQQLPILKDSFFSKVIQNEFASDQQTEVYLSHLKMTIPNGPYIAVFLYLSGGNTELTGQELIEIQTIKLLLKEYISKIDGVIYTYDNDFDKMIILFNQPDHIHASPDWMKIIEDSINALGKSLIGKTNIRLASGGGIPVQHLSEIGLSVNAARLALTYCLPDQAIIWHSAVSDELFYFYPADYEIRIINFVCTGKSEAVFALLDDLYQENFDKRYLSKYAFKQLIYSMLATINNIVIHRANLEYQKMKEIILIITNIEDSVTANEFWDKLHQIYNILCECFCSHQQYQHAVMIQCSLEYIAKNYPNAQLNIDGVSHYIGLSADYFSKLFKQETGEYFSDYLENCRIEAAKVLLENDMKIEIVSQKVGYNSSHAFRRAFKRITGINPTLYRSSVRLSQETPNLKSQL